MNIKDDVINILGDIITTSYLFSDRGSLVIEFSLDGQVLGVHLDIGRGVHQVHAGIAQAVGCLAESLCHLENDVIMMSL